MNQADLARKLDKSEATIARWINGERALPKDINVLLGYDEVTNVYDNIIKRVCSTYNLTYNQLSEITGYESTSLGNAARTTISKPLQKTIELYIKNRELEEELRKSNLIKATLKEWLV